MTRFDRLELTRLGLALEALAASVLSGCRGSPARLGTAVRGLLGLGRGTTPSGDDLLAGAAAAARAGGLPGARCLCQTLAELAPGSTTPAGEAMLREAAAGFFPHPLAALARSWPEPRRATLDALIGIGVSSGADMLAGFLAITEGRHA